MNSDYVYEADFCDYFSDSDDDVILQETGEDTNVVKAKHARTKDYTCTVCEKSYSSKGWLENHQHSTDSTSHSSKPLEESIVKDIIKDTQSKIGNHKLLAKSPHFKHIEAWFADSNSLPDLRDTIHQIVNLAHTPSKLTESIHTLKLSTNLHRIPANHILQHLVPITLEKQKTGSVTNTHILSDNDKRGIYYVAGFVIRSVSEMYSRIKKPEYVDELERLVANDSAMAPHADWTVMQSRGGLLHVSQAVFDFFCTIESTVQPCLNSGALRNCKLLSTLTDMINDNDEIFKLWYDIFGGDASDTHVYNRVVRKYCNVRCRAFVDRVQKLYMKTMPDKTSKSSASLRKDLKLKKSNPEKNNFPMWHDLNTFSKKYHWFLITVLILSI